MSNQSSIFDMKSANGSGRPAYCNIIFITSLETAWVSTVISFILIVLGAAGNILSFIVLKYSSKDSSSQFYLRALAIADTLTLLLGFPLMVMAMFVRRITGDNVWIMSEVFLKIPFCPIRLFVTFFTRSISVFIIVLFTIERCIIIYRPTLTHSKWFTVNRAKIYVTCIVLFSFVSTFPTFFAFNEITMGGDTKCRVNDLFFAYILYNLTMLSGIPSAIIVFCNTMIVGAMKKRREQAEVGTTIEEQTIKRKQHAQVTKRLLWVSSGFVCLSLPLLIVNVIFQSGLVDQCNPIVANLYTICLTIYIANFSVNFTFYCLTTSQFRLGVRALLCCQRSRLYNLGAYLAHNAHPNQPRDSTSQTPKTSMTTIKLENVNKQKSLDLK